MVVIVVVVVLKPPVVAFPCVCRLGCCFFLSDAPAVGFVTCRMLSCMLWSQLCYEAQYAFMYEILHQFVMNLFYCYRGV